VLLVEGKIDGAFANNPEGFGLPKFPNKLFPVLLAFPNKPPVGFVELLLDEKGFLNNDSPVVFTKEIF